MKRHDVDCREEVELGKDSDFLSVSHRLYFCDTAYSS